MSHNQVSYLHVRPKAAVHRTIQLTDSVLVDVTTDGLIVGVETLDAQSPNWLAVLSDDRFRFKSQPCNSADTATTAAASGRGASNTPGAVAEHPQTVYGPHSAAQVDITKESAQGLSEAERGGE